MAKISNENFPANPIKPKEEPARKVQKVVKGGIYQRKEPILYQIFGGETANNIATYILWDVLIPAIKSTLSDMITNSVDMLFYGEGSRSGRSTSRVRRDRDRSYVSYNSLYDNRRPRRESSGRSIKRNRDRHRFDDIIFDNRTDAEEVLTTLVELVDQYDLATVEDFYDAAGLQAEYTDGKYGWDDLREAMVRSVRGGYILSLPTPLPID